MFCGFMQTHPIPYALWIYADSSKIRLCTLPHMPLEANQYIQHFIRAVHNILIKEQSISVKKSCRSISITQSSGKIILVKVEGKFKFENLLHNKFYSGMRFSFYDQVEFLNGSSTSQAIQYQRFGFNFCYRGWID